MSWLLEGSGESQPLVTEVCVCVCVCVSTSEGSAPATAVGLWPRGAAMSRCQQVGRLGSRSSYWSGCVALPQEGSMLHIVISIMLKQRWEQDEAFGAVCVSAECVCLC